MYRLTGVTKRYTRGKETVEALRGIDLTIEDGDQLVIQGPTGGGKSTLLQMIGGLDRPTDGSVELDGEDLARISETKLTRLRAEKIGIIFQSFNLIPTLTAQENVETALVPLGVKPAERRERAAEALRSVGLGERLGHAPAELSGGQQQRVAIARALVKKPKVLLADEPTGNLDEGTRDDIMALLEGLWHEYGLTFIMVTHDSSIARRAPRLATIKAGQITLTEQGDGQRFAQQAAGQDGGPQQAAYGQQPYVQQQYGGGQGY
ncbi:putative ABC transport system ATP-binding protein [Streptomyces sp. Ag109_O5-1]|uniref:ABC transporter ATP-binding protein n=1 Tax=Streptomyces sp. Ag109_O5-1 TaxID=1938851 RepID=UPI000F4E749B|nr:ABC transporter ATP-binding protein [Streptomyces sp. Ag109_O5-1]RPE44438.1 putative ABC transport system ATP-binding protein [Streptomyces sp. Ag109_O5-1]